MINQSFSYDTAGRLQTITDGIYSSTYAYTANSALPSSLTHKENATLRLTTTKQWDFLNRLIETKSSPSGSSELPSLFRYGYNDVNQRTACTMGDGSYWVYQYDNLGQVISGKRFWGDGTPVAGQQFEYGFDDIGNRKNSKSGGDGTGQNLQAATYTPNLLNQYSQRSVPGIASAVGIANPTATVTVNSSSVYRKGEYFWKELSVANGSASIWQSLSIQAVNGASSTTVNGNEYIAKTPEVYSYDLDGNLTQDGRWTYTWDAENRLVRMVAATAHGPQQRIDFSYDPTGRRIRKQVWNNTSGTGTAALDTKFLYDGWNLVAELDGLNTNANIRSYLWGSDMSGSRQVAGGVGGLLFIVDSSSEIYYTAYDGNGNLTRVVTSGGSTVASYEYGPFGESIRASGSSAAWNPIRFSTKYRDSETDLLYYGHRYFWPVFGKWLSRDPLGEKSSLNFTAFCRNDSQNRLDRNGRDEWVSTGISIWGATMTKWFKYTSDPYDGPKLLIGTEPEKISEGRDWDDNKCQCIHKTRFKVLNVYSIGQFQDIWQLVQYWANPNWKPGDPPIMPPYYYKDWVPPGFELAGTKMEFLRTEAAGAPRQEKEDSGERETKEDVLNLPKEECTFEFFGTL